MDETDRGSSMKTIDAINQVIDASGKGKKGVSEAMGRSGSYLSSVINQSLRKGGGVRSSTLSSIADVCGYALAFVPADMVDEGMVVIDPPSSEENRYAPRL